MDRAQALYRIGAVSSLTGLPPNTIRTWERRYEVVTPERSGGGGRRYSDADVERLQLLRTLSSFGEAIGSIATLDNERLRERIQKHNEATSLPSEPVSGQLRLGVLHEQLRVQVRELGLSDLGWTLARHAAAMADFVAQDGGVDVLVLDLAALGGRPEAALESLLEQTEARLAVVVYDFAERRTLSILADAGARLVRGPLRLDALERMIRDHLGISRTAPPSARDDVTPLTRGAPSRRYTDAHLARFREMRSSVQCECPNHLASLITSLNAFEAYSRGCVSRSPEDAALHAGLAEGTAQARAQMEDLLNNVLVHDGVRIPTDES